MGAKEVQANLSETVKSNVVGEPPSPQTLSRQLREETGGFLPARRKAAAFSLVAAGCMSLIALYQLGLIRHLPEPPLPGFDADRVDASDEAYARYATPDAVLGLSSFTTTLVLIAMGGRNRAETQPVLPLVLAAKALFDAAQAGKLSLDQWVKHRAFCFWCLISAVTTVAVLPFVLPEAWAAWRTVRRTGQLTGKSG